MAFTAGSDGGSAITNYKYTTDGSTWTAAGVTTSPITISGLSNGTAYNVQIKAVNNIGDGTASTITAATPYTTPGAPTTTGVTSSNQALSVAFTAGTTGGSSITNYQYSTNGSSGTFTAFSPAQTSSPLTISNLVNGTTYSLSFKAMNAAGAGNASTATNGTPYTTPAAPSGLSVTNGNSQVTIAFTAGTNNGSAITNYQYSIDGGTSFTAFSPAQNASPVTITGLSNGTTYSLALKAMNAAGAGSASTNVSGAPAAPESPTISVVPATLASALTTTYGTSSAKASFSVSGTALTGDLTVTAPAGFEVCTTSGGTFTDSVSLTASSGSVASTTIYARLKATAGVSGTYNGVSFTVTGGGATQAIVATAASGNAVSTKGLTITGLTGVNKEYDRTTAASTTGTATYSGLANSESFSVTGTPTATFANANVGTTKLVTITGYLAPSANYTLTADPTVTADITAKALTIPDAAVTAKTYDNTTAATITGTLTGVISGDTVTFTGTGTFASAGAGSGISVTSSSTLGGASSGNYSLTQPTGLTGDINKASQTITFGALPNRNYGEVFALSATVNSGLTVSYASSDTSVVTVSGNLVTAVGVGTTTITASVAGNDNYNAASTSQSLTVVQGPFVSWTFESTLSPVLGSGTATLIGGTTSTYATGVAGNGLNTTAYPAASTGSGTAGVKFSVPTSGTAVSATGIVIGLDFRQSATSSKYWQLQLSSDGTTFVNASGGTAAIASGQNAANTETAFSNDGLYVNNPGSGSQQFVTGITYTLTGSAASAYVNNSNFAWRWVSVFSPGGSSYAAASSTYGTAGTARFDNVYVQYLKQSAQTIAFGSLDAKTYGDSTFALSATANSGLSVSYSSSDTSVATVAGSTVTILKAGSTVITASQAGNAQYAAATSVQQTLTVGAKALTIGAPTLTTTKEYDGTTTAAVTAGALSGVVGSDTVTASATAEYDTAGLGTSKTIMVSYSLGGAQAGNYSAPANSEVTNGVITAKALTITGISIANKTYDGTTAATITGTAAYSGLVGSESFAVAGTPSAVFDSVAVGNGKSVTVSGYTAPTANYSISQPTGLTANIGAASLSSGDITITPVGDGSFTASATGVSGFSYSYSGRTANGIATSYSSSTAPTAAGFYTVTATSTDGNYSGSGSSNYFIAGPVAVNDATTKPAGNPSLVLTLASLLVNDVRITPEGAVATDGLSITGVINASGNSAEIDGGDILFTPGGSSPETFTYVLSYGSQTAIGTVTVTTESSAPTFALQIAKVGTATYSAPNTTVTHDFIGVPNQTYALEYTTDLNGTWTRAGDPSTGATGSFSVTITESGDVAADWNAHMFFRARLVR